MLTAVDRQNPRGGSMALVHDTGRRSNDLAICGLALVVIAIIAISVPCFQLAVNMLFGIFE